jgi:hypothetical protein
MGEMRNAYNFSDRSEEKRAVKRPAGKWDDNIKNFFCMG